MLYLLVPCCPCQISELEQEKQHLSEAVSSLRRRAQADSEARVREVEAENRALHQSISETGGRLARLEAEQRQATKELETLRERAERVIELYPSNTIVLGMFLEAQKGQTIWGRVKALFGEGTEAGMQDKDLSRRVAEVWVASWEKGRWEAEQERTRGGLSAAVQSERYV